MLICCRGSGWRLVATTIPPTGVRRADKSGGLFGGDGPTALVGKAIIEAKDDVGQMLFAAGTGLADLRERLKQLEEEADQLWAPRKSERRLFYQAQDRLEEAQSRQREQSLTVGAWRTARITLSDAEKTLQDFRKEHEGKSKELKKLARIRHVHGAVRQRRELTQGIAALGDVIVLAEDASKLLRRVHLRACLPPLLPICFLGKTTCPLEPINPPKSPNLEPSQTSHRVVEALSMS